MTAAVLSIGTELTRGELVNTNAAWLGEELTYPSSPLYPYLIAPFFLLGGRMTFWAIYLFQAALDAMSLTADSVGFVIVRAE